MLRKEGCSRKVINNLSILKEKTRVLSASIDIGSLGEKENILSDNIKTGYSINFPPAKTCKWATEVCKTNCYASNPSKPITWKNSIIKQLKIYNYFMNERTYTIASRLLDEIHRKKLSWIRWNGSGDLFIQSVRVINLIAQMDPDIKHLVVTRSVRLAKLISQSPNIYLMFSLDGSRVSRRRKRSMDKFNHPRLYYSYLRINKDDDTLNSSIVFNKQYSNLQKEKFYKKDKGRHCPVDSGLMDIKEGCNKCKKCFSEKIIRIK